MKNILNVLGHPNTFIAKRLWDEITKSHICPDYRRDYHGGIKYKEWMKAILQTVFNKSQLEVSRLIFKIYDIDGDGVISSNDLTELYKHIPR